MKWININNQLPPDNENGEEYQVTVFCNGWNPKHKTMVMEWDCAMIKGKEVRRWKWRGGLVCTGWKVTHWAELLKPAANE